MNELEVQFVLRYIDEHLFEPTHTWPKCEFEHRTYSRWAAYEIVQRLMDYAFDAPCLIIDEFIFELECYSHMAKDPQTARMFSIAKDAATDILCILS